jgi:hypothetical protein
LQTIFAADAHLAEGQLLHEEPAANKEKHQTFQKGTRMLTVSSKEGQNLKRL